MNKIRLQQIEDITAVYVKLANAIGTGDDAIAANSSVEAALGDMMTKIGKVRTDLQQSIADLHVESVGFLGTTTEKLTTGAKIRVGSEFVVDSELAGTSLKAEVGDYLICKTAFTVAAHTTAAAIDTMLGNFVIVEQNLTNAVTVVSGGAAEAGKYVSAVTQNGHTVNVTKSSLPVTGVASDSAVANTKNFEVISPVSLSGTSIKASKASIPKLEVFRSSKSVSESEAHSGNVSFAAAKFDVALDNSLQVFLNGVLLPKDAYAVEGTEGISVDQDAIALVAGDDVTVSYLCLN